MQSREVLLDGRRGERRGELLDVGGGDERSELREAEPARLTPGEETDGVGVGLSGVRVPDLGGEEVDEPPPADGEVWWSPPGRRARMGWRPKGAPVGAGAGCREGF
jgi:hypothetical protein